MNMRKMKKLTLHDFFLFFCWTLRNASYTRSPFESPQKAIKENVARHILCVRWTLGKFSSCLFLFSEKFLRKILNGTYTTLRCFDGRRKAEGKDFTYTHQYRSNEKLFFFSGVEAFEGFFLSCVWGNFQWAWMKMHINNDKKKIFRSRVHFHSHTFCSVRHDVFLQPKNVLTPSSAT
jgi:hypothetical protein